MNNVSWRKNFFLQMASLISLPSSVLSSPLSNPYLEWTPKSLKSTGKTVYVVLPDMVLFKSKEQWAIVDKHQRILAFSISLALHPVTIWQGEWKVFDGNHFVHDVKFGFVPFATCSKKAPFSLNDIGQDFFYRNVSLFKNPIVWYLDPSSNEVLSSVANGENDGCKNDCGYNYCHFCNKSILNFVFQDHCRRTHDIFSSVLDHPSTIIDR